MLHGDMVGLRARQDSDIPLLHADLYEDVATRSQSDSRPWRPIPLADSPARVTGAAEDAAIFSVVLLDTDELAGDALLWGIDTHNRAAHLGISLRPAFRGRGLGSDTVRVLCRYGFEVRGLHRLQIETLAGNAAMLAAAARAGFTREGTRRQAGWVTGQFADEAILGLLAEEWSAARPA